MYNFSTSVFNILFTILVWSTLAFSKPSNETVKVTETEPKSLAAKSLNAAQKYVHISVGNVSEQGNASTSRMDIFNNKTEMVGNFPIPIAIRVIPTENETDSVQMLYANRNNNTASPTYGPKDYMEDVEETFTYQVKRQNKNRFQSVHNFDKDLLKSKLFQSLVESSKETAANFHEAQEHHRSLPQQPPRIPDTSSDEKVKQKLNELEQKVMEVMKLVSNVEKIQNKSYEKSNATLKELYSKIYSLNTSFETQASRTTGLERDLITNKNRMEGHIATLSMHLRNNQNQTGEQLRVTGKKLDEIYSSIQNASQDIRMNEVRTRYNQKAITILDKLAQANNDQISEANSIVGPRWNEQTEGCGGVLVSEAGLVSYKFRQPYLNNERCIWTIRANRRSRIVLQLIEDGFQNSSNSDFITVTEFADDLPGSLVTSSRIEHGNRAAHTFRGPLVFISFYTDSSITGNGFLLKFKGAGNTSFADLPNSIRYKHLHLKEPVGHLNYPDAKNILYQPNEITTFAINPPATKTLKTYLRYTDLEKEEGCDYDSVNFFGSVMASYALSKKYCDQQQTYNGESLQSSDGTFIVVFRSDTSTQFKGFQFSWETL